MTEEEKNLSEEAEASEENTAAGEAEQPAAGTAEAKAEEPVKTEEAAAEKPGKADRRQKKAKTDKEKDALREQVSTLEDKVKRQLAEFENFRNRTDREKSQMFDMGQKAVLEKLLPVIDNFERGLQTVPEGQASDAFVDGMNMIYRQLMSEMEKLGVTPIEALGQPFDPNLHSAVMQSQSDEYESGTVSQELQKGYMFRDTVLRHSMVAVVE